LASPTRVSGCPWDQRTPVPLIASAPSPKLPLGLVRRRGPSRAPDPFGTLFPVARDRASAGGRYPLSDFSSDSASQFRTRTSIDRFDAVCSTVVETVEQPVRSVFLPSSNGIDSGAPWRSGRQLCPATSQPVHQVEIPMHCPPTVSREKAPFAGVKAPREE
jgi:hypothetical protein